MCGISGIVGPNASKDIVYTMLDTIQHRGRDKRGVGNDKDVCFGCNRLSIIDIEGGDQPVWNEDNTIMVIQNGEIYNYLDLRKELISLGHLFKSGSDTEVILHGYEEYGLDVFRILNGMFAIAIWDGVKKQLILARDRIGIKPLYYSIIDDNVVFASEIKAIMVTKLIKEYTYDKDLIDQIMTINYPLSPGTMVNEISMVHKATCIVFDKDGISLMGTYWAPPKMQLDTIPTSEGVLWALKSAIERQTLTSDVPVGAFLSGGLDTSTIVALASKVRPIKTFCMGFGDERDEFKDAELVASHFNTDHTNIVLDPSDSIKLYPKMLWHSEYPKTNLYTWSVNEAASKHVKVCLSGAGGDELFCGYPTTFRFKEAYDTDTPDTRGYLKIVVGDAITPDVVVRRLDPYFKAVGNTGFIQNLIQCEFHTKLPYDYLMTDDAMSMAHTLEVRTPLLDNNLVDLMYPVPWKYQMTLTQGKLLLRGAMKYILPQRCFDKPKWGFSIRVNDWWHGGISELYNQYVPDSKFISDHCDVWKDLIGRHVNELEKESKWQLRAWLLLGMHMWNEMFIEGGRREW